jgi:hypothetical protein
MPVARVVAKGLVRYDSLLAVHSVLNQKMVYKDSVIKNQQLLISSKDTSIAIEKDINLLLRAEIQRKDGQISAYKKAATESEKRYKKLKFWGNVKTTSLGIMTVLITLSLTQIIK